MTVDQIDAEHWEVMHKICEILFTKKYSEKCVSFARAILDFLSDHQFLTWKQFDSIMCLNPIGKYSHVLMAKDNTRIAEGDYYVNVASKRVNFTYVTHTREERASTYKNLSHVSTDRQLDRFYGQLFGHDPFFQENDEGLVTMYDKSGGRFFGLPTGDEPFTFPIVRSR